MTGQGERRPQPDTGWDIDSEKARDGVRPKLHELLERRFDEEFALGHTATFSRDLPEGLLGLMLEQAIDRAIADKDVEGLTSLTHEGSARRRAFAQLLRGPGHPPGPRKATVERDGLFAQASREVGWAMEELEQRCPGKTIWPKIDLALEVVAQRYRALGFRITERQLRRFYEK